MREAPEFQLYHSLSEPIFAPATGDGKLFYCGINWERLGRKPVRHGELLKLLDETGDLRIYGPKRFNGVDVWAGFKSYTGPVPFDGVSIVGLIHKAGVSLVLSSEAHLQSELMSSRLFESLAAGAVIICDDNPFAHRFLGETVLYIDTTRPAEETYGEVQSHLDWIRSEPAKALELAKQAQEIFLENFALGRSLQKIYADFPARRQRLESLYAPKRPEEEVSVIFLMPEYAPNVLERHIASCLAQKNVKIRPILAMDVRDFAVFGGRIQTRLNDLPVPITVETLEFFEAYPAGRARTRRRAGHVIHQAIERLVQDEYFCIVSPAEELFSDHLCSLLRTLQDHEEAGSAWADMLLAHKTDGKDWADLNDEPGIQYGLPNKPIGFGRFLFRKSALTPNLGTVLPYLGSLPMHLLFGVTESRPTKRCTLVTDIQDRHHEQMVTSTRPDEEHEIVVDYAPQVFSTGRYLGHSEGLSGLSLDSLRPEQKTKLAIELAHSVPLPGFLKKIGFGLYRLWLRRSYSPIEGVENISRKKVV
jgi:hypothetical protein